MLANQKKEKKKKEGRRPVRQLDFFCARFYKNFVVWLMIKVNKEEGLGIYRELLGPSSSGLCSDKKREQERIPFGDRASR